jgi:hypothetical protein
MICRDEILRGIVLLPLALACPAMAQEEPPAPAAEDRTAAPVPREIEALRREVEELRQQVQSLREQLQALTGTAAGTPAVPPAVVAGPREIAPVPSTAAPTRSQNLLNPAISAVFQAIGNTSLDREDEANGFDLSEAELAFQSVVDPYAKVDLFLSFPAGESPEVEEGFVTTLSLPKSLQLKGGRFKSAFGKWNTLHTHAFFSVDRPDALTNFLGEESLASDGLSLSVLVPNPWDLYIDSFTEVGTALEGVSFNGERRNLVYLEHLTTFFNTSADSTLEIGVTATKGQAGPSETLLRSIEDAVDSGALTPGALAPRDTLDSAVQGVDVTYKWKPLQRNVYRSFLWQTELIRSRRDLEVLTASLALSPGTVSSLGGYSYAEWQPAKRWRLGARFDLSGFPDSESDRTWAGSGILRFQPSEFQEIRLQLKHTRRNGSAAQRFDGVSDDDRIFVEWIPVIGAHGAHKY